MKITKEEMVTMMIENEFPPAMNYLKDRKRHKYTKEERIHYLRYHVLKDTITLLFKKYLYWKIEEKI